MGRLTQGIAFLEVSPRDLTKNWELSHLTKITPSENLIKLRRKELHIKAKQKNIDKKM